MRGSFLDTLFGEGQEADYGRRGMILDRKLTHSNLNGEEYVLISTLPTEINEPRNSSHMRYCLCVNSDSRGYTGQLEYTHRKDIHMLTLCYFVAVGSNDDRCRLQSQR
jgi:hypothetical protein